MPQQSIPQFLIYSISPGEEETDVDRVKQSLFFVRQVFSVVVGIAMGMFHLQGITAMSVFMLMSMGFSYFYVFKYKQVDEEKIENTEVYTEALPVSIGEFLLTWILVHTATL